MIRFQLVCLALLTAVACDERASPIIGARAITAPTAPTAPGSATFEISGTVVEIGAGPVAGATVSAKGCASHTHVSGQTVTDATGAFRISQLPTGCVLYLSAEKGGFQRTSEEPIGSSGGNANITLRIQRLRRATGRVVDVEGGVPVSGVKVSIGGSEPAALSDAGGFFVLNGVGGSFSLDKDGFVFRNVPVPGGQDVDLGTVRFQRTIEISAGASLTGQISSRDVYYDDFYIMGDDGVFCSPCKSFDLQTGQQDLEIRLQWSGQTPLALWAATYSTTPYEELRTRPALPGESSLSLRVPAATRVLLVGVGSPTPGQQTVGQPVPFELTAIVR